MEVGGTALRNDEPLSYADVVLLETKLNQDYGDQDKWKQVDIDGDESWVLISKELF